METITDKKELLEAIKQDGLALHYASDKMRDDKKIVLKAVKQDGYALRFASERLRNDIELVYEANIDWIYIPN